jgi:tape measure domain-containing protein
MPTTPHCAKRSAGSTASSRLAAARYSGIGAGAGVAAAGMAALGLGVVSVAANAELAAVSMEVMLGSAAKASAMISAINAMAVESPFGSKEFTQAAQVLLNFGVTAENVLPTISMLGDVAAGDSEKLERLTLAFGQMSSAGRLMGQDLLQMINAGFNPLQEISKRTGESMMQLRKRMEAGEITSHEVAAAFQSATSAGGRFAGMTARISKSTIGTWAAIKDETLLLAKSVGDVLLPTVNIVLTVVRGLVGLFKGWGKAIALTGVAAFTFAAALTTVIAGLVAYAKAAAVAAAFTGPKGWAMLAGSAIAAGAAVAVVSMATSDLKTAAATTNPPLKTMAGQFDSISESTGNATTDLKAFASASDLVGQSMDEMKSSATKVRDEVQKFQDALAMSGQAGMVLTTGNPLVEAFTAEKSGYVAMLEDINREIAVLSGNATEAGLRIADMMAAGVDPARIKALQDAVAKRDELAQAKENKEYWKNRQEELQNAADEVKASIRTVEDRFAMERQRHSQLVEAGMLTQTEADKSLAKIRDSLSNSGRSIGGMQAQDIRTVSGASQLTSLINRTGDVSRQQLAALQQIARNTEGGFSPEVVQI